MDHGTMTVEFTKPDMRLERLVGGRMPKEMPKALAHHAETASKQAKEDAHTGMLEQIEQLWQLVDATSEETQSRVDEIYFKAHDLRGLCSTVEELVLSGIADALCSYIEETRDLDLTPRSNIIWLHVSSLMRAAQDHDNTSILGQYLIESLCALRKKELEIACPENCSCSFSSSASNHKVHCKKPD